MARPPELNQAAAEVSAAVRRYLDALTRHVLERPDANAAASLPVEPGPVTRLEDVLDVDAGVLLSYGAAPRSTYVRLWGRPAMTPEDMGRRLMPVSAIAPALVEEEVAFYPVLISSDTTMATGDTTFSFAKGYKGSKPNMRVFCMNALLAFRHRPDLSFYERLRRCGVEEIGFGRPLTLASAQFPVLAEELPFVDRADFSVDPAAVFFDLRPGAAGPA